MASKWPVRSLQDFKGRKVLVSSTAQQQTFEAWGSSPVRLQFAEVYAALQTGMADAAVVNSNSNIPIFEVQKYLLDPPLKPQVAVVVTRDAAWSSMPFRYRARIGDVAIDVSEQLNNEVRATEKVFFAKAKAAGSILVSFQGDEAQRATHAWIDYQPTELRGTYRTAYEAAKSAS